MKKSRIQKLKNIQKGNQPQQGQGRTITRQDMDRMLFDMVMGEIYENSDVNSVLFEDILHKYQVELPVKEKERIWDVITNSMWISPMMGFGQAGKLELTPQGFQLMAQYGSYSNYLAATQMPISQHMRNGLPQDGPASEGNPAPGSHPGEKKEE